MEDYNVAVTNSSALIFSWFTFVFKTLCSYSVMCVTSKKKIWYRGEKREKVDLTVGFGVRPAREHACRRRSPLFLRVSYRSWIFLLLPRVSALSEL